MHPLKRYLDANKITQLEFARRIGRTQAFVSRLCAGSRSVSLETALLIERETGGLVPVSTWAGSQAAA